ncbi:hypothetical protein LguiA_002474 [Lonicera macranthoides]
MSVIHLESNVLRKNYGNNRIVVIPRISAFETSSFADLLLLHTRFLPHLLQTRHVLEHGKPHERSCIITQLVGLIVQMSQQRFASNVVEKCLTFGSPEERQMLVNEMLGTTDENEPLQYRKCIKVHLNALKKYTYGKHIVARVEKLVAAGELGKCSLICMIAFASSALCEGVYLLQRNITGFRPVIDLAFMRDVVNKLSSNSKKINPLVNLEFRGRVVFNADSVLGTDSCTSMNSQVTKPGNIAEDSSIISAHEHVKTSHGSFIHPQGSKELVGSLETEWKTTNQYLLKEHAWLRCTRRCMFALVPQLNNLLRKPPLNWLDPLSNQKLTALHPSSVTLQLLQNLISNILSFGQCRNSIENTPTIDTGLLSNLHVFLLVHNSHPPPCRLNCMRQQKVESLDDTPSRSHKQVGQAILPIVASWQSNISSCDSELPTATHMGKIDTNLLG